MNSEISWEIGEIARELDMVVFRLEQRGSEDEASLREERKRLRRQIERLRDRLQDLTQRG